MHLHAYWNVGANLRKRIPVFCFFDRRVDRKIEPLSARPKLVHYLLQSSDGIPGLG